MAAIAVGAACIDRAIGVSTAGLTYVTKEAAADGTGTITSIKVFPATSMTGFDAGVFTDNGGNDLTCTKAAGMSVAAVATACRQFTSAGLDFTAFAVTAGQYAGLYTTTGGIERVTNAGAGYWTKTGDYCADDTNSAGYTWYTPRTISLLLEGETGGGPPGLSIPIAFYHLMME